MIKEFFVARRSVPATGRAKQNAWAHASVPAMRCEVAYV